MWCAYTILIMAVYWICECLPLAITSLIPVVLLPLTGITNLASLLFIDYIYENVSSGKVTPNYYLLLFIDYPAI
jgi:hypothetical protein